MTYPISIAPPPNVIHRRSLRLLAMVAELHKAGYQKLRIAAGMSPSGMNWRCLITHVGNVHANGWEPFDWDSNSATYTSGNHENYFDWDDANGKTARELAKLFLERYPELAKHGEGYDYAYAGWFCSILGDAENGRFPIFYADWLLDPAEMRFPPTQVAPSS